MRNAMAFVLLLSGAAFGQSTQVSSETRQAILDYQLTMDRANQLIPAMQEMTKYVASLPDFQERMRAAMKESPAERIARIQKDSKAMAILKQHGLTVREYVVGVPALRMALMAANGASSPMIVASPANIAFAKAHYAELKPKMDAADGMASVK